MSDWDCCRHTGIHFLDLANVLMGCHPAECTGFTANVGGQPLDVEDAAAAALRFRYPKLTCTNPQWLAVLARQRSRLTH